MFNEGPLETAARYRHIAEYIADAALSPYLVRMAEDYERQAADGSVIIATVSLTPKYNAWATA